MQNTIKNEIEEFETHLTITRDFLTNLPKQKKFLQEELKRIEDERQDLLHYAEFGRFNACEGFKISKELQRVQQERRKVKDMLEVVESTWNNLDGKYNQLNRFNTAIGEVRKKRDLQDKRKYRVRVREDLAEKINKYR